MLKDLEISLVQYLRDLTGYQVWNCVPPDAIFPYVHITKVTTKDWSSKTFKGTEIIFYINVYDRNTTNSRMLDMMYIINNNLPNANLLPYVQIIKMKKQSSEVVWNKMYGFFQASTAYSILVLNQ